ncbi:hypothetical protein [Thermoflexibacter ruber]|uniref:SpoIIAA-like n=1 Tax=Thermoflexibacter ruber TaxID=1003 RepID=A0A1I2IBK1_9BACT|nr:hypothetical protein [Thermoflexibacter ruber]SFF39000.1 hypothetical protein SAMN04488541_103020 [Thermoflexibacter ruber]
MMTEETLHKLSTNKSLTPIFKDICAETYHVKEGNIIYLVMKGLTKNQCYQTNAERALSALVRFNSCKMLIDFRNLVMLSPQDQQWMEEVWQRQAVKVGLHQLAIVMPDGLFAILSTNKLIEAIKKHASFDTESFLNDTEAYDWLV